MKKLLWALPLLIFGACNQNNVVKIEGTIKNAEDKVLYLDKLHVASAETLDSIKIDKNGRFRFKIEATQPEFHLLRLSTGKLITLLTEPSQEISLNIDGTKMDQDYTVEGSKGSQLVKELNDQLSKTKSELKSIIDDLKEKQGKPGYDEFLKKESKEYQKIVNKQRDFSSSFIMKNATSLASYMALYQKLDKDTYTLNNNEDIRYVKVVASSMKALYPESEYTTAVLNNLDQMQKALSNLKIQELINKAGTNYPDIEVPDVNGKNVKLSSLKGKFIVLNFWSAQDKESHKLNKTLKKIYNKYNGKGLEIYQVSVDRNKEIWQQTVKADNLNWINVCEPKNGSALAAGMYNVQRIPANYLISKQGEIVGKNLFGIALEEKVEELMK